MLAVRQGHRYWVDLTVQFRRFLCHSHSNGNLEDVASQNAESTGLMCFGTRLGQTVSINSRPYLLQGIAFYSSPRCEPKRQ